MPLYNENYQHRPRVLPGLWTTAAARTWPSAIGKYWPPKPKGLLSPTLRWEKHVPPHRALCQSHQGTQQRGLQTAGIMNSLLPQEKAARDGLQSQQPQQSKSWPTVWVQLRIELHIFSSLAIDFSAGLHCSSIAVSLHQGKSIPKRHLTSVYSSPAGYIKTSQDTP